MMRQTFNYYTLSLVALFFMACSSHVDKCIIEIENIKSKYIPDSRVAVYDVHVDKGDKGAFVVRGETTVPNAKMELISSLQKNNSKVIDSITVLPDLSSVQQPWALVTVSVANLRDRPRYAAQLVSQIIMGTPVKILKQHKGWVLVQCPDRYIGWTNESSLQFINEQEFANWKSTKRKVLRDNVWVLDAKGKKVSDLVAGSIVKLVGDSADLLKVALPDERWGYIGKEKHWDFDRWTEECTQLQEDKLVDTSFEFMGLPYLWGGTSAKGVDCSGFMKNIYFLNGYILARDASQQVNYGLQVDSKFSELQKGDLLFFGNIKTKKVTHVGMYIGDTEFIHSSARVMVNSLDPYRANYSDYRAGTWLHVRRYVGQMPQDGLIPVGSHPWYVLTE